MSVRTNNPAESVHAQINPEVNGKLSLYHFLAIIEERMLRGRERIRDGCQSESRRVEQIKNEMLADELDKLLNGREGVLAFLDNCASITSLQSVSEAKTTEIVSITTVDDITWTFEAKRGLLKSAACGLYNRLCPNGQLDDHEILSKVPAWSFQFVDRAIDEHSDHEEL